ncbi:MAG TPA: methyltransferase domain-containing protein, partial [Bacteroidetes bacterium]|nr:methyltransferase domain-containing protein [Bacteroidota bacterium]HEX04590.1 methyltransferase domain-containing protein [Bacteroidota bacterium]
AFPMTVNRDEVLAEILRMVKALHAEGLLPDEIVDARVVEDEDWVGKWRRSLGPIRAGERFVIVPPGVAAETSELDIVLAIEPRMAFGTGDHATTRLALAGMERLPLKKARVIDLGCGNGILTVAAALSGAAEVESVDFEEESVIETVENAERHGVAERVHVHAADVLEWTPSAPPYDILLANIYLPPILSGIVRWCGWLHKGSHAVFTGVRAGDEERELLAVLDSANLRVLHSEHLDTWFCVVCEVV